MPQSNDMFARPLPYCAYLVRLWQSAPDTPWCASAQSVASGEIVRFGSLQALWAFLEAQTTDGKWSNAPPPDQDAPEET
jgi:hypothetical protein